MNLITNNDINNNFMKIYISNFNNNNTNEIYKLFINEVLFEELLNKTIKMNYKNHKNSYNIYNYNDLNFKIFSNKSSYCYRVKNNNIINKNFNNYFINILNYDENQKKYDDFPAFKQYNNINIVEEIFFEIEDNISLIFSKINKKLFIYIKIKNENEINISKINLVINNLLC